MPMDVHGLAPLLQVFDMPTSLRFYRDVVGFEVVGTSLPGATPDTVDWAWLRLNDAELMLNTAYEAHARPPAPDAARNAVHGDTTLYLGCPDLDAAHRHLCDAGVAAGRPFVQPYGMRQMYLRDPDGYQVCFQWPAEPLAHPAPAQSEAAEPGGAPAA